MEISERLARLEERMNHMIKKIDDIKNNHLPTIYNKLEKIASRPSWTVAIIITFLSSLSVGLIILLIRSLTIKGG